MQAREPPAGGQLAYRHWSVSAPRRKHAVGQDSPVLLAAAAVALCGVPIVSLIHLGPMSAHMAQHIAVMNVIGPAAAVGLARLAPPRMGGARGALLWAAACSQMALLWAWHAPPLQAAAMSSSAIHALMLTSLFAAALWFWGGILLLSGHSRWQALVALAATGKLSCLLGALLIFAPRLLYPHGAGHAGADSLQDQQLAGLLMIVACPLSYVLAGVVLSAQLIYGLGARGAVYRPNRLSPQAGRPMASKWQRQAARVGAIAAAGLAGLALAALLVAWSGIYSVAASRGHWAIVEWFLAFGMRNSVKTHALLVQVPPLQSPDLVRLGAGHFHGGCAYCHGAPGFAINPVAKQMLPPPPPLSEAVKDWATRDLFWIVKNGLKYTGMPAWVAQEREDEVWAVVAFLRRLPHLTPRQYRELALDEVVIDDKSGAELATTESDPHAAGACARCHGAGATAPASNLVPVLHGQKVEYLTQALEGYANGSRRSGIMQPLASDLDAEAIMKLARYYAGLPLPQPRSGPEAEPGSIERGRRIAAMGVPQQRIPACNACHGPTGFATFPRLDGQNAAYLVRQLELWNEGLNAGTAAGAIMAPIARRLTDDQMRDVSAYYASLAPRGKKAP